MLSMPIYIHLSVPVPSLLSSSDLIPADLAEFSSIVSDTIASRFDTLHTATRWVLTGIQLLGSTATDYIPGSSGFADKCRLSL